jgi:hypothetical protein
MRRVEQEEEQAESDDKNLLSWTRTMKLRVRNMTLLHLIKRLEGKA